MVLSRIKIIGKKFELYSVQQPVMDDVVMKWNSRCIIREVEIAWTYQCSYFKAGAIEHGIDKGIVSFNVYVFVPSVIYSTNISFILQLQADIESSFVP